MANFCVYCGSKLNERARFCQHCGAQVAGNPKPQTVVHITSESVKSSHTPKRKSPLSFIIPIAATIVTVLITVICIALNSSDKKILKNFSADETYFLCGRNITVIFTVENDSDEGSIRLRDENDQIVGTLHDNGVNGDKKANDNIFTYAMEDSVVSNTSVSRKYYVENDMQQSEYITLHFICETDVAKSHTLAGEIDEKIKEIESEFVITDSDEETAQKALTVFKNVENYINSLAKSGDVVEYYTEGNSIIVRLTALTYVYTFQPPDDMKEAGNIASAVVTNSLLATASSNLSGKKILSVQPYAHELTSSAVDKAASTVASNVSGYTFVDNMDNDDVSIEFLKELYQYKLIIWDGHGGYSAETHSFIGTGESNDNSYLYREEMIGMNPEILSLSGGNLGVTAEFFSANYEANSFDRTILYLGVCHGADDNVLAQTLIDCGMSTVFAYKNSVSVTYDRKMCEAVFSAMSEKDGNTGKTKTANAALTAAKSENGKTDAPKLTWWQKFINFLFGTAKKDYAELKIIGDKDIRLLDSYGSLTGKVCMASDRTTQIAGATINVYKSNKLYLSVKSDSSGAYRIALPAGEYTIKIAAEGYVDFSAHASVNENMNTYMETFLLVLGNKNQMGIASGYIINSLTGEGISDVSLSIRQGWNATSADGQEVAKATCSADGSYSVSLPLGNYTVVVSKDGCESSYFNIIVQPGETGNQNGTITPAISGSDFLITLTWGAKPLDMDSHLVGIPNYGSNFHIYFQNSEHKVNSSIVAVLDYDDTDSYGPEHITIKEIDSGTYYYYVHRYYGEGTVAGSEAKVRIEQGGKLIALLNVPTDQGIGDFWNVFAVKNGQLIIRNTVTGSPELIYAE